MCQQYLEQVDTNVTFVLPGLTIDTENPPITLENMATYLHTDANSISWQLPVTVLFNSLRNQTDTGNDIISPFIQALVYGEGGTPLLDFEAEGGIDKFFSASSKLFGKYMAQAINLNMRNTSANAGQALATWSGVVIDPSKKRTRQNLASKLVLQVVLGVMTVYGVLAYLAMIPKALLPNNPSSIVGVAKLLAGSDMCALYDKLIRSDESKENYDGWFFGLGWWGDKEVCSTNPVEGRRFGIDIGRAEKALEKASEKDLENFYNVE